MQLIIHKENVYEPIDSPLWEGFVRASNIPLETREPHLEWRGPLIAWETWSQLVSFFRWSYLENKGEAQARLAFNSATQHWAALVLPQEKSSGMSTRELPNQDAAWRKAAELLSQGYELCGTAHHHCDCNAFQSGVDRADEIVQTGVHITIGHVERPELDIHVRSVFRGHQYATEIDRWVALPETVSGHLRELDLNTEANRKRVIAKVPAGAFPEEWKRRLIAAAPRQFLCYPALSKESELASRANTGLLSAPARRRQVLQTAFSNLCDAQAQRQILASLNAVILGCSGTGLDQAKPILNKLSLSDLQNALTPPKRQPPANDSDWSAILALTPRVRPPIPETQTLYADRETEANPADRSCVCLGTGIANSGEPCSCPLGQELMAGIDRDP